MREPGEIHYAHDIEGWKELGAVVYEWVIMLDVDGCAKHTYITVPGITLAGYSSSFIRP